MGKKITLNKSINNTSIQVGDIAYFVSTQNTGSTTDANGGIVNSGISNASTDVKQIGVVTKINSANIHVENVVNLPSVDDFVMFSKDKSVNNTSLLGYYAKVKLSNSSIDKAELFALGSEVTPSSK